VVRLIGPGPEPDLDSAALAAIGIDLEAVRSRVEAAFGPGALDVPPRPGCGGGTVPFTARSKKCLELALREAVHLGDDRIRPEHVLLGILREGEGVGARILAAHGVTGDAVRARLNRAA
jgi:ATP-dependent Clp protease ATP-binding subunit ClpA